MVRPTGGSQLRSRLRRVLLSVLLVHRGEVVPASTLAASLWPDGPPPKWDKGLQVHVHRLRQALGDPGTIRYHPPGYRLAVPGDRVDAYRFEQLARQGQAALAHGAPERAAEQLRQALGLYRGQPFQGLDHVPDLAVEAHRLAELRLAAMEHRIAAELALGAHAGLVAELAALVAEHPLRERFRAQLMTALYRAGRKADALAAYRTGRRVLVAELGVEPSEECRALERAILADDPSLATPPAPAPAPASTPAPPPTPAPASGPRQLPPDVTAFTGRAEQLRWLDQLLDRPGDGRPAVATVSAVDGMAGVGKTALVVHWAHRAADRFPDGQLYVDLRGYSAGSPVRPVEVLTRFLRALEPSLDRFPVDLDEAAARYRSLTAGRRVLVVLDNAYSADQVRPLLPAGAGCLALVTSRHRLPGLVARDGARRLDLDVLPSGEAVELLTSLLGAARVAAEPAAVSELAGLCGHLPLAVRVAAAVLISHPSQRVADSAARLRDGDRLAALAVPGDQPASVAAAFEDSYRRLPEPEQRMLCRVGLLPGPEVSEPAAAALAAGTVDQVAPWLRALASAHLLEERPAGRFGCHDLLRQFAAGRARTELPPAEQAVALARWYGYYLAGTDAAVELLFPGVLRIPRPDLSGPDGTRPPGHRWRDPGEAMAWLHAERANLVAAVRHASGHGPFRVAWQLADSLQIILGACGFPADALAVAQAGLAAAEADGDRRAQAGTLLAIANLHFQTSRYPLAVAYAARCRRLLPETDWPAGRGGLRFLQGSLCGNSGQPGRAIRHVRAALEWFERAGSRHGQAAVVSNLAVLLYQQGRLEPAADYARRAERCYATLGSHLGRADALTDLGGIHHVWGEYRRAEECYTRARDLYRTAGASREADAMFGLAQVHLDAGRPGRARALAEAAVALARAAGDRRLEPECLVVLASVYHRLGRHQSAEQTYRRALQLARDSGNRGREALALVGLAAMRPPPGDYREARERASQALGIVRQLGLRIAVGEVLTRLAEIELAAGDPALATRYGEEALACHREVGFRLEEARTRLVLGHTEAAAGDRVAAREHWQQAYAIFQAVGAPEARDAATLLSGADRTD